MKKIMSVKDYNNLRSIDTSNVYETIKDIIVSRTRSDIEASVSLAAYALYQIKSNPSKDYHKIEEFQADFLNPDYDEEYWYTGMSYASHRMIEEGYENEENGPWDNLYSLKDHFSKEELIACALFGYRKTGMNAIPVNFSNLVFSLIPKKKRGMRIANLMTDGGSFLVETFLSYPRINAEGYLYGGENSLATAYARLSLIGIDKPVLRSDAFLYPNKEDTYDLIFLQPFISEKYILKNYKRSSDFSDEPDLLNSSFEWNYIRINMEFLKKDGKLIAVFKKSLLTNRLNKNIRNYFIGNGWIEKVISLPEHLFESEGETALVIFSYGNNKVEMIDGRDCYTSIRSIGKKTDIISLENIEEINKRISGGKRAYHRSISNSVLLKNDCSLNPERYIVSIQKKKSEVEYVPLAQLVFNIKRAAQFPVIDYKTDKETSFRCLQPKNIKNGIIMDDLPYLKEDEMGLYDNFILSENTLVITRNGEPFKVAVFGKEKEYKVVAAGNLYIIPCKDSYEAYYLKAFFESEKGTKQLINYARGTGEKNLKILAKEDLCSIKIPYLEFEQRQIISEQSKEMSRMMEELQRHSQRYSKEINNIF